MKKSNIFRKIILGSVIPILLIIIWYVSASREATVIPKVSEVIDVLLHPFCEPPNLESKSLAISVLISILRFAIGYFLAVITAVPLGILIGRYNRLREIFSPIVEIIRPISPIAWLPITIIIFGFSSISTLIFGENYWHYDLLSQLQIAMIVIIWGASFFPILLNAIDGAAAVKTLYIESAYTLNADSRQIFWKVIFPASLPAVMTGLKVGMGIAWRVIVAAEIFPGTRSGLGYMIATAHQVAQYEYAFAGIIVIAFIGLVVNIGFDRFAQSYQKWQSKER